MKKLIGAILACVMILSLAGCGNSENETNVTAEADAAQEPSGENDVTGADSVQTQCFERSGFPPPLWKLHHGSEGNSCIS